jgi:hypothetical protein
MNLFKYYRKAVIYPSIFILFFCIIYSIIDNYKSEWLTAKSVIVMSILTSLIFSLLICGLSLTIFLNKFEKLNKNLIWNILTWFLLPFAYISIILIHDIENRIKYEFGFGNDFLYLLIMTMPFVIGLCWTFIKYRQKITTDKTQLKVKL